MLPFLLVTETGLKKGLLRQGVSVPRRKSWCCRHGPNSLAEISKHISKEMFSKQIMNLPKLNKCLFDQNPEGHVPQLVFSQSFRIIIDGPKFQCLETVPRVIIGETHSFFSQKQNLRTSACLCAYLQLLEILVVWDTNDTKRKKKKINVSRGFGAAF